MTHRTPQRPLLISTGIGVLAAIYLAGCGITNPYLTRSSSSSARATAAATTATSTAADALDPTPERHGTIPARTRAAADRAGRAAGSPTARGAVLRYAALYVNWTACDLRARQRQLARLSVGAARLQALQEAASAPADRALRASHVANHGQVISAQPGSGPAVGRWVIVTREQTTGQGSYHGLPAQLHVTYAITTRTRQGWEVSLWSPQT